MKREGLINVSAFIAGATIIPWCSGGPATALAFLESPALPAVVQMFGRAAAAVLELKINWLTGGLIAVVGFSAVRGFLRLSSLIAQSRKTYTAVPGADGVWRIPGTRGPS